MLIFKRPSWEKTLNSQFQNSVWRGNPPWMERSWHLDLVTYRSRRRISTFPIISERTSCENHSWPNMVLWRAALAAGFTRHLSQQLSAGCNFSDCLFWENRETVFFHDNLLKWFSHVKENVSQVSFLKCLVFFSLSSDSDVYVLK